MRTYYEVLGLSETADQETIRKTYLRLIQIYHPDHNSDANAGAISSQLIEAYSVLGDPNKRAIYDATINTGSKTPQQQTSKGHQTSPPQPPPIIKCQRCGRQDASLRMTLMYWVFSVIVLTRRNGEGGIWCERCRARQAAAFSIISGLVGWWGFPFGPIYTLHALYFNAIGGKQDKKQNAVLLRLVALQLYETGRISEALKALDTSVDLEKDPATIRFADELRTMPGSHQPNRPNWFKFLPALPSAAVLCIVSLGVYSCFSGPSSKGLEHETPAQAVSTATTDNSYEPAGPDQQIVSTTPQHKTGDEIASTPKMRGRGRLSLINGTGEDAVALMFSTRTGDMVRSTYIRAGETFAIRNITPGRYWVRVTQGQQWDDLSRSFLKFASYFTYPTPMSFTETHTETQDEVHYFFDDLSLTLHAVPNGNIQTQPISKEDFWRKATTD